MECHLPEDTLQVLEVKRACRLKKIQLRELQSLLGNLNFACRIMPMGRIFSQRLALTMAGVVASLYSFGQGVAWGHEGMGFILL